MRQTQSTLAVTALRWGQHLDSIQALALSQSEKNFFDSEGCFFYWAWEERPDFIVFGFTVTEIAMIISEALEIPLVGFFLQPVHEIQRRDENPTRVVDQLLGPVREGIDSAEFNAALMQIMERLPDGGITVNRMRRTRGLGRRPRGVYNFFLQYHELTTQRIPQVVPISDVVLGGQADQMRSEGMTLTSFIFLRSRSGGGLDRDVADFVDEAKSAGRKVAIMAFSSIRRAQSAEDPPGSRGGLRAVPCGRAARGPPDPSHDRDGRRAGLRPRGPRRRAAPQGGAPREGAAAAGAAQGCGLRGAVPAARRRGRPRRAWHHFGGACRGHPGGGQRDPAAGPALLGRARAGPRHRARG
ncbi:unnamed protein product, partial [Prorocentrum cordatum]